MNLFARIIVDLHHPKVDKIYTYLVEEPLAECLREGMLVEAPFGGSNHVVRGYVIELLSQEEPPDDLDISKLKALSRILTDQPVFSSDDLAVARRMKEKYMAPLSSCLALFLPKNPDKLGKYRKTLDKPQPDAGAVFVSEKERLALNPDQEKALSRIASSLDEGEGRTFLLFGITGSGKTEVYLRAIEKALSLGKDTIMLVPEISLTPQLIAVFEGRFGSLVGVTHSRMTDKERSLIWTKAREGLIRIIIGPRSALFTPFQQLGLIILDEEHENSYFSEKMMPHYHSRDVARMISKQKGAALVLGSATPDIVTYHAALAGEYELLSLPRRAVEGAELPKATIVDMRREMAEGNMGIFCQELYEGVERRLQKKEQVILFLNRKGYATFVNCRSCGFVLKCPRCELPYTYHKEAGLLICHHCGKEARMVDKCPNCQSGYIRQFGLGTEKVEEAVRHSFPSARVFRMDMSTMKKREDYEAVYRSFSEGEGDILIGTQMVAKGFDFPRVTLVGVLASDLSLYNADYHSPERTFQLLTQVAGRAGREKRAGEVIFQTFSPDHYCLKKAKEQDYLGFYEEEVRIRRMIGAPPFTHIAQLSLSGKSEASVERSARALEAILRYYAKNRPFEVLGPSPAQVYRLDNTFRYKLLVKCADEKRMRAYLTYCIERYQEGERRHLVSVDVDPMAIL